MESTVLCYIKKDNKYLMLFRNKKENDLNEGKYMGIECNEGELFWIDIDKVYDLPAWEGDKVFLEKLLKDEKYFNLELIYAKDKLIKVIEK